MHRIGNNTVLLCLISCSYGVQVAEGRLDQCQAVYRQLELRGNPMNLLEPEDSNRNSYHDKKDNWITTDAELWKE